MHIRPIVQAPKHSGNSSLAVTAAGLFGFAVLISGLWHPKFPDGGLTQIGRDASVTFEDGSVLTLSEPESDLDILRRRRMAGWGGHDFQQIFIKSDGTEMEVINDNRAYMAADDGDDLGSGDQFMLTAYHKRGGKAGAPLDQKEAGIVVADLHVDGKDRVVTEAADPKDRVVTDVIDNKDKVVFDPKDTVEQPVFALTTTDSPYLDNQGILGILMGDPGSMWGNIRTITPGGGLIGGGGSTPGGGGTVTTPPIGTAVPEPGTWSLVGLAGVAALAVGVRRRKMAA